MNAIGMAGIFVMGVLIVVAATSAVLNPQYRQPAGPDTTGQISNANQNNQQAGDVRTIQIGYRNYNYYFPDSGSDTITLKAGEPVRLEAILDGQDKLVGCTKAIRTQWGSKVFKAGDSSLEFTPQQAGTVPFSCSMGMATGTFKVVSL